MESQDPPRTTGEMEARYGDFFRIAPKRALDKARIPRAVWPLIPYAALWGIPDDVDRERLRAQAPKIALDDLRAMIKIYDPELDKWLAGPEAAGPDFSREYIAFTLLRMLV